MMNKITKGGQRKKIEINIAIANGINATKEQVIAGRILAYELTKDIK